jgi:hypothetical protein
VRNPRSTPTDGGGRGRLQQFQTKDDDTNGFHHLTSEGIRKVIGTYRIEILPSSCRGHRWPRAVVVDHFKAEMDFNS